MARRNPPARWTLPEIVNPPTRKCFTILVPNEPYHIAAFRGALLNLASAYNWQDDLDHTAKDVANVWKSVIVDVTACGSGGIPFACPFDYIPSTQGWSLVVDSNLTPNTRGVHVIDSGWQTTYVEEVSGGHSLRSVRIKVVFAYPVNVQSVTMQYNLVKGTFVASGFVNGILCYNGGTLVLSQYVNSHTDPDGNGKIQVASSSGVMCDEFQLIVTCGVENKPANPGGGAVITFCQVNGTGVNPCS